MSKGPTNLELFKWAYQDETGNKHHEQTWRIYFVAFTHPENTPRHVKALYHESAENARKEIMDKFGVEPEILHSMPFNCLCVTFDYFNALERLYKNAFGDKPPHALADDFEYAAQYIWQTLIRNECSPDDEDDPEYEAIDGKWVKQPQKEKVND